MEKTSQNPQLIIDFVTGREIPLMGAEENRQAVERFLVEKKGYSKTDIDVNVKITFEIKGEPYHSVLDLVVSVDGMGFLAIKCAAGSLGSREREILSAARLVEDYQIPFSMVSDGKTAVILDTITGKRTGKTLDDVWDKKEARGFLKNFEPTALSHERAIKERLIFRSYDSMNVNVVRDDSAG